MITSGGSTESSSGAFTLNTADTTGASGGSGIMSIKTGNAATDGTSGSLSIVTGDGFQGAGAISIGAAFTLTLIHTCIHTCIHAYIHKYIHAHTLKHIHIFTHIDVGTAGNNIGGSLSLSAGDATRSTGGDVTITSGSTHFAYIYIYI